MGVKLKIGTSLESPSPGLKNSRNAIRNLANRNHTEKKYTGIIADSPNIELVREDGQVFAYDDVMSMQANMIQNFLEITGGNKNVYPLAYVQTGKEITFNFQSALFGPDIFENIYCLTQEDGDFGTVESRRFVADTSDSRFTENKYGIAIFGVARFGNEYTSVTLPFECKIGSIVIRGMEEGDKPEPGVFSVFITRSDEDGGGRTIVYFSDVDVSDGDAVRVAYQRRVIEAKKIDIKTTSKFAICELYSHWPTYSWDGVINGWVHLYIPRCRVTEGISMEYAYKTHAAPQISVAALPPADKRVDNWFDIIYEPVSKEN